MFSYRNILKQAWTVTWKHKYLWFLGLFASLVAGSGSWEYKIATQSFGQNPVEGSYLQLSSILTVGDTIKEMCLGFVNLFRTDFLTVINTLSVLIITLTILVFFIWLAVASQAGLVASVKKIITAKKAPENLGIRESLTEGHRHFWPVLGLNIFMKALIYFVFFIIGLPLLFMTVSNSSALFISYIIMFVIFIPVAMGLSLLVKYAIAYKVVDNKPFFASLEKGAKLFCDNWLVSLEMAVILFLLNFLFSGVVLIILALLLLPLFMIGLMFGLFWLEILVVLIAIAIVVIFGAFLTTFQIASWTDLFLHLKDKGGMAKLERIFKKR